MAAVTIPLLGRRVVRLGLMSHRRSFGRVGIPLPSNGESLLRLRRPRIRSLGGHGQK